jgi:hypothetical protein
VRGRPRKPIADAPLWVIFLRTYVQGVDSQPFDFPDNFLEIFALTLKFALKYQYVAGGP